MSKRVDTTRRQVLQTGLAAVGAVAAVSTQAQEKLAQKAVQYQAQPKDGNECDTCVNWQPPNACKIVTGTISPKGWCVAFAPKQS